MRTVLSLTVCVILSLVSQSCRTAPTQTPDARASRATKEFLISRRFRHEDIYTRHYTALGFASWFLGFSLSDLKPMPSTSAGEDVRTVVLRNHHFWPQDVCFVITAEGGGSLDDPNTPCSVRASLVPSATDAPPKDWVFMGFVWDKEEWKESGTKWAAVDVEIIDENLLDEIRLIYNPADGVVAKFLSVEFRLWYNPADKFATPCSSIWEPMPEVKCPAPLPALVSARARRRCRLVFTAPRWDRETIESGEVTLKSLEWIRESAPDRSADARRSSRSKMDATSAIEESRRDGIVSAIESRHRNAVEIALLTLEESGCETPGIDFEKPYAEAEPKLKKLADELVKLPPVRLGELDDSYRYDRSIYPPSRSPAGDGWAE